VYKVKKKMNLKTKILMLTGFRELDDPANYKILLKDKRIFCFDYITGCIRFCT
jgi:hypothetical protein